jgi:hypothetical protein
MIRPAFDSTKQAVTFGLLLLFFLAAPWLSAKKLLPQPKGEYSAECPRWEKYPWLQKFIFEETNDIDIAFVGSSHLAHAIDTPYVQQQLDGLLGRRTVVRSVCWEGGGFDALYFISRELLAHRHVKVLVFYDETSGNNPGEVQQYASRWFRYRDEGAALAGLPLADRAIYYFAAMVAMPRNLLALVTPNLSDVAGENPFFRYWKPDQVTDPATVLGCLRMRLSYDSKNGIIEDPHFTPYLPQTGATSADIRIYSTASASSFVFSNRPTPFFQTYFAGQFGSLARTNGCQLVFLHLPVFAERTSPVLTESCYWPGVALTEVCMMGLPGAKLFAGLSEAQLDRLYADPVHFNENGQNYFTRLFTPALLQFYENHATH